MDIELKKQHYQELTTLGDFDEINICDACVERGGLQFTTKYQQIYLTTSKIEPTLNYYSPHAPYSVKKNYCYNCAEKKLENEIKLLREMYFRKSRKSQIIEEPKIPQCFRCKKNQADKEKFIKHANLDYCLDCVDVMGDRLLREKY
jgi:hypothetical protein